MQSFYNETTGNYLCGHSWIMRWFFLSTATTMNTLEQLISKYDSKYWNYLGGQRRQANSVCVACVKYEKSFIKAVARCMICFVINVECPKSEEEKRICASISCVFAWMGSYKSDNTMMLVSCLHSLVAVVVSALVERATVALAAWLFAACWFWSSFENPYILDIFEKRENKKKWMSGPCTLIAQLHSKKEPV